MNEHQLRRLLRRVLLSAPLPLAVFGAACGGSSLTDGAGGGESGGSPAGAGAPSAGSNNGGAVSIAGAGPAGAGGAIASAGSGGAFGGAGGAIARAGAGGAIAGAGAGGAVAGGAGGAGSSGGNTGEECKGHTGFGCASFTVTIPKSCFDGAQPLVGTSPSPQACNSICNVNYVFGCTVSAVTASDASVSCDPGCAVGRRPEGMVATSKSESNEAGGYFAQIAQLEAASVIAFRILRDELRALGAPQSLVRAAGRAARDEIRHARSTSALARRFGGTPRPATVARGALRSLEAIALENAVEGCVRETYGALLATRQAQLARDPVVRAAMMRIARDETRHASLSWRVARWLETRLEPAAQQNVERAKQRAARDLQLSLANEPACRFADSAGLPSPTEAVQLAGHMNRLLWS